MQNQKSELCQCCLLRTSTIHLKANIQFGKPNTYEEMLQECYDIHLQPSTEAEGICGVCIRRLRDAYEFRLQVLNSYSSLQQKMTLLRDGDAMNKIKPESNTSENPPGEANVEIKQELNEPPIDYDEVPSNSTFVSYKRIKREVKAINKRHIPFRHSISGSSSLANRKIKLQIKSKSVDNKVKWVLKNKDFIVLNDDKTMKRKSSYDTFCEKKKIKNNINNIIKHTNCTPFGGKEITGFVCYYCKNILKDLPDLKSHVSTEHGKQKFIFEKDLRTLSFKMDITDLQCTLCNTPLDNIASVTQHLIDQHKLTFHKDVPNYIQEFKLPLDGVYQCALCNSKSETFKMLLQHMNSHYRNFVCETCDAGFLNSARFNNHKLLHNTERFKCSQCDKTFKTAQIRHGHEKLHKGLKRKNWVCPHCGLELSGTYYWSRNKHLMTEHNIMAANYECNICERTFIMKSRLTQHIKKDHLLERNNKCPECDYTCYCKRQMRMHMIKHTGERKHKCDVCHKAYTRRCVLKEHMRIHNNDRRHKCYVCGSAFVQKCSLKSHLLSHHSMSLEENNSLTP